MKILFLSQKYKYLRIFNFKYLANEYRAKNTSTPIHISNLLKTVTNVYQPKSY